MPNAGPKKVMVVDDDPIVLEVTKERLVGMGYEVVLRDQAIGTSAAIVDERPEIVLLDISMPGLTGDSIAELVQRRIAPNQQVAVIFHSSKPAAELSSLVDKTGAVGAIHKGVAPDSFSEAFTRLTKTRSSTQS